MVIINARLIFLIRNLTLITLWWSERQRPDQLPLPRQPSATTRPTFLCPHCGEPMQMIWQRISPTAIRQQMTKLATEMTVHTCPLTKDALTSATATFGRETGETWRNRRNYPVIQIW